MSWEVFKRPSRGVTASPFQTIDFGSLSEDNTCVAVVSDDLRVISSAGDHVTGSSKIRMNNIVDYSWEEKYYSGQLLAVHKEGNYIAYGIKGVGLSHSAIRIVNRKTTRRTLIKGIEGMIEDLAFAFVSTRVVLASLDLNGNLLVHNITEDSDIRCDLLLHIISGNEANNPSPKRVFWCPYIPEQDDDPLEDDTSQLLAITRDNKMELWNVQSVSMEYGAQPIRPGDLTDGYLEIEASSNFISDAAFSPDGTAIATASHDGKCKFYQVYMAGEGEPRCLHEWEPHGGEAVTSLLFLDDHDPPDPFIQFWKYAITGAKDNSELKLWCCETWKCLQTITFVSEPSKNPRRKFKISKDLSAGYILLSDMYTRLLYVLELDKDSTGKPPLVKTITEFKLPCPILSFGIADAGSKTFKTNSSFTLEDLCDGEEEEKESQTAVVVKMFLVQPKSLQECLIVFQTNNAIQVHHNTAHNIPVPVAEMVDFKDDSSDTTGQPQPQPILMTPDAFHSPAQNDPSPQTQKMSSHIVSNRSTSPEPQIFPQPPPPPSSIPNPTEPEDLIRTDFVSVGSSPSREVQEILSSPCFFSKHNEEQCLPEISDVKMRSLDANLIGIKKDIGTLTNVVLQQAAELKALREEHKRLEAQRAGEVERGVIQALASGAAQFRCAASSELIAKHVAASIGVAIGTSIAQEFQKEIRPIILRELEVIKETIQTEVSRKLAQSDNSLQENLGRILRSKTMISMLSKTLTTTSSSAMDQVYKDTFAKSGLPIFERAAAAMFQQINQTFTSGLSDYKKEIEEYAIKSNERSNMELVAVQSASEQMTLLSQKVFSKLENETKRLEEAVSEVSRTLNRASVNMNNGNIRSGAVTPAPFIVDSQALQTQLSQLIKQGQLNQAFQQALSASDLNLVMYVCEKVGPHQVFNGSRGCVLQQHVLLSLIQQLSADMSNHTETRHKYLEEAVMCIDPSSPYTRDYMPGVISALQKQLHQFYTAHPNERLARKAKMLHLATKGFLI